MAEQGRITMQADDLVGKPVRLRPGVSMRCPTGRADNQTATVECTVPDIAPGAVKLDRDLNGCRYWNISDLEETSHGD